MPRSVYSWHFVSKDRQKELMQITREIAFKRVAEGVMVVLQGGNEVVDKDPELTSGPIRLRLSQSLLQSQPNLSQPQPQMTMNKRAAPTSISSSSSSSSSGFDKSGTIFRNFQTACQHYRYPGSHQTGSYGNKQGILRSYSNGTRGKTMYLQMRH